MHAIYLEYWRQCCLFWTRVARPFHGTNVNKKQKGCPRVQPSWAPRLSSAIIHRAQSKWNNPCFVSVYYSNIWRISHGCPEIRNFSWSAKNYFWPPMCAANGWNIFLTPGISIIGVHIIYMFISKCLTFNTFRSKHLVSSFLRETSSSMAMTKQWMRKCRRPLL